MPAARSRRTRKGPATARGRPRPPLAKAHFVGRDPSPVLERYPPKDPGLGSRPVVTGAPAGPAPASLPHGPATPGPTTPPAVPLIRLDRAFDLDGFSEQLGETSIRVTVPREELPEVLRRVLEFTGFGIYVYTITVRPAPAELLKSYVVELQRVDYSAEKGAWVPFVEKGALDSPYGSSTPGA